MRCQLKTDFGAGNYSSVSIASKYRWLAQMLSLCVGVIGAQLFSCSAFCSPVTLATFQEKAASKSLVQSEQSADSDQQKRLDKLINQLGSPSYAVRQAAAEQIWRLGKSAAPTLERAVNLGDPEVAKRAQEILTVLAMGIDFDTDPKLAKLVLRFNQGEREVKESVLSGLLREQQLELVFELLEQVESDDDQSWLFDRVLNFNDTITSYGRTGRWDEIELIHQHPITLKHKPIAVVQYHLAAGTIERLIESLEEKIGSAEKDGKKVELKNLVKLIAILRMQRRFDEAEKYIAKIEKDKTRNRFSNRILMERGDWNAVARKMPVPGQEPTAQNGLIEVTNAQRALVYQFVGDQAGHQEVVQKLLKEAEEAKSNGDEEEARAILDNVVGLAMVNLDWDLAYQHLDFEDVDTAFETLVDNRRIDEAFDLIGLGDTVQKRDAWFDRKMRHISSLRKKIERLEEAHEDTDLVVYKLNSTWQMCLGSSGIANTLGSLGLVDEAAAHYHTMFASLSTKQQLPKGNSQREALAASDLNRRCEIVGRLFWIGRYEEVRRLCEQGFSPSEIREVAGRFVEVQKSNHISFWMGQLSQRYPDPLERLHVAAGIVNSPFCGLDDFDLRLELASIEPNPKYIKSGLWDYRLAEAYQFHGDEDKYVAHLQMADQAGYASASSRRIKQAVLSGDSRQVVEFYDSPPNNVSVHASLLAAEAYRELGDVRNSALRTAFAFAQWEENYSNSGTTYFLGNLDKQYLAVEFLKLQVYHSTEDDGSTASNERYRGELAQSQLKSDPEAAINDHRILLFDLFAGERYRRGARLHWANEMIKYKTALAQAKVDKGELDEALQLLLKCDRFAPGDPGLGEELIAALDQEGGAEQADRLFEQMSGFYFELLAKYPESPLHHNNYAWLCACAKRRQGHMLRHAKIAVEQRPESSSYLDTLATIYFLLGEKEKAIDLCRRCIAIYPSKQHYREQLTRFMDDK